MESVARQLKEQAVQNGAVVSLIGAVDACCISNMPSHDATQDILAEYEQPFELSGTGEIKNGVLHLHCVLSKKAIRLLLGTCTGHVWKLFSSTHM